MSAPANRWLVLVAMTGSLSMIMLDQTVVTVALPAMSDDLGLRPAGQQWVVKAYVLALTALERVPRILRAGCGRPGGCCIDTI